MSMKTHNLREAFDFSRDAQEFKKRLWNQLQAQMRSGAVELEDEDLTWVNAAGVPFTPQDDEDGTH